MADAPARSEAQCSATRQDGQPCKSRILTESGLCGAHDPALAEQCVEGRRKGGRNSAKVARMRGLVPPRLIDVYDELEQALGEVHGGALSPSRASAMASLARAMVTVLTAGELEERLRAVEQAVLP